MQTSYYHFGMRQPATRVSLIFKLPDPLGLKQLDEWILEALESDVSNYQPMFSDCKVTQTKEETFLIRWLFVTTLLLQDIRVPVFEKPVIEFMRAYPEKPGCFAVVLWFPIVESFPIKLFHSWLFFAYELISKVSTCFGNQEALEKIYQNFHYQRALPSSLQISGGKSTIPMLQAAFELGIPIAHAGSGRYLLGWGSKSCWFDRSGNGFDSALGAVATHNKYIALQWMRFAGIPVPKGKLFASTQNIDFASLENTKIPLVVKPVDRDRGEGVTLGIRNEADLQLAVANASKLSKEFLVEEQVEGTCHRILVVNDKIIYAVKRHPRGVVGDGIHTLEELVAKVNAELHKRIPMKRLSTLQLDQTVVDYLALSGLETSSIPALGRTVYLRPAQSTQWGGDPEVVTNHLHPDNAALARKAAKLFGLRCAGIDFISSDITIPWHQNGAVINEVNYSPVVGRTHEYQRLAAKAYLEELFPTSGKIPIDVYLGESAKESALLHWQSNLLLGQKSFLGCETEVLNPVGEQVHFASGTTILEKISLLRANTDVDSIVAFLSAPDTVDAVDWPFEDGVIHNV